MLDKLGVVLGGYRKVVPLFILPIVSIFVGLIWAILYSITGNIGAGIVGLLFEIYAVTALGYTYYRILKFKDLI